VVFKSGNSSSLSTPEPENPTNFVKKGKKYSTCLAVYLSFSIPKKYCDTQILERIRLNAATNKMLKLICFAKRYIALSLIKVSVLGNVYVLKKYNLVWSDF
jgi:hypothetical protein